MAKHWLTRGVRFCFVAIVSLTVWISIVAAVEPEKPMYQVNFWMNSEEVLDDRGKLQPNVLSAFSISNQPTKVHVQYIDSQGKEFATEGWNITLQKKETKSQYELIYSKHYPIRNGNIQSAMNLAFSEGFDMADYNAKVEWGYQKQTLIFAHKASSQTSGSKELPNLTDSINNIIEKIPPQTDDWLYDKWGTDVLNRAQIFGPITGSLYKGTWNGAPITVQVWSIKNSSGIGNEKIVEISFETSSQSKASKLHDDLIKYLKSKGWLLSQDVSITDVILDRY